MSWTPSTIPSFQVRDYFNTTGFERWNKIYGETDEVNKVQLDIRTGEPQPQRNLWESVLEREPGSVIDILILEETSRA